MRLRLAITLDIRRDPKPPTEDIETALTAEANTATTSTGPSFGFRLPDPQPEEHAK